MLTGRAGMSIGDFAGRASRGPIQLPSLVDQVAGDALQSQSLGGEGAGGDHGAGVYAVYGLKAGGGQRLFPAPNAFYFGNPGVGIQLGWSEKLGAGLLDAVFHSQPVEQRAVGSPRARSAFVPCSRPLLFQPMFPITGPLLAVHYGDNPDTIYLLDIDHRVGEDSGEMAAGRSIKNPEQIGLPADRFNQPLDFVVEPATQPRLDFEVIVRRGRVFLGRLQMEIVRLQRPTSLRIRADTWAPGMPCTFPPSMSAIRWRVSAFQLSSIPGLR